MASPERIERARVLLYGRHWRWKPWYWSYYYRVTFPSRVADIALINVLMARLVRFNEATKDWL